MADAPRLEPPRGLSAEYEVAGRMVERHEPYPFYFFLAPAFSNEFDSVWRGRLTIPEPGGYRVEVESNARASLRIDGRTIDPDELLAAGVARAHLGAATTSHPASAWHSTGEARRRAS